MNKPKRKCPHCGERTTWTNYFEHSWEVDPEWRGYPTGLIVPLFDLSNGTLDAIRKARNTEFDMCDSCGEVVC